MRGFIQIYMTIGAIFAVILAGPLWFAALFGGTLPTSGADIMSLLLALLVATFHGVVRAFAWLPSLIFHVGVHKMPIIDWLFGGGGW